jgi:hypothetical protein
VLVIKRCAVSVTNHAANGGSRIVSLTRQTFLLLDEAGNVLPMKLRKRIGAVAPGNQRPSPPVGGHGVAVFGRPQTRQTARIKGRVGPGLQLPLTHALRRNPSSPMLGPQPASGQQAPRANSARGRVCPSAVPYLPEDLHAIVLSSLPAAALGRAACVCRSWRKLADEPTLWRHHLEALEVPEQPEQATACREAYIAWTACTRYPPVCEADLPTTKFLPNPQVGRGIAVFRDAGGLAIVDLAGQRLATLPNDRDRTVWRVVETQILTAFSSGIIQSWNSNGTLHSTVGEPLPSPIKDFAADTIHVATICKKPHALHVTERASGAEVYRTELKANPARVFFLDKETLGLLVILPPRLQIWRRDRPELLRTLVVPPELPWSSSIPVVTPTRMLYLDVHLGILESYIHRMALRGPDAGRLQRIQGADHLGRDFFLVGESLICKRARNYLTVVDARTGKVEHEYHLGGPSDTYRCIRSAYRDRVAIDRHNGVTTWVEIWRFAAPSAERARGAAPQ